MSIARSPSSRSALYDCTEGEGSGCEGSITPPLPSRLCHSSTPSTRSVKLSPLDQAWAQERLRRCHLCAAHLSPNAELYFLDDAVYCCASHRARSAAVDRFSNEAKSLVARRLPTTVTGVGLSASHRSWFCLEEDVLSIGPRNSSTSSESSACSEGGSKFFASLTFFGR
ncbi:hypothetical protein T492DRAFT_926651 [Pavlovales sp. CCMP2436]|nr:hypothetical protein T492DRAFT_926651 [Pavlovales sp. CCMP2436]|mmetsp:Transcript_4501/g.11550  ORF Transcript_4501/g.11550 Transcript_4501/m.11550 type:complete len:169 (+) Transcript_4501:72-578(+)